MSEIRLQCCYVLLKRVIQSLIVDFQKEFFQKVCLPLIFLHMTNTQAMSAQLWQFRLQC